MAASVGMAAVSVLGPMLQEHSQHSSSMALLRRMHEDSLALSQKHFDEEMQLQAILHMKDLALERELHALELLHENDIAKREAVRDVWSQRNQHIQTLMTIATLMFSCAYAIVVQGDAALTSNVWLMRAYALCQGISVSGLFISIWFCLNTQLRMSMYNIHHPATVYRPCGKQHYRFLDYFRCHCEQVQTYAFVGFYVGTGATVGNAAIYAFSKLYYDYGSTPAAVTFVIVASSAIFAPLVARLVGSLIDSGVLGVGDDMVVIVRGDGKREALNGAAQTHSSSSPLTTPPNRGTASHNNNGQGHGVDGDVDGSISHPRRGTIGCEDGSTSYTSSSSSSSSSTCTFRNSMLNSSDIEMKDRRKGGISGNTDGDDGVNTESRGEEDREGARMRRRRRREGSTSSDAVVDTLAPTAADDANSAVIHRRSGTTSAAGVTSVDVSGALYAEHDAQMSVRRDYSFYKDPTELLDSIFMENVVARSTAARTRRRPLPSSSSSASSEDDDELYRHVLQREDSYGVEVSDLERETEQGGKGVGREMRSADGVKIRAEDGRLCEESLRESDRICEAHRKYDPNVSRSPPSGNQQQKQELTLFQRLAPSFFLGPVLGTAPVGGESFEEDEATSSVGVMTAATSSITGSSYIHHNNGSLSQRRRGESFSGGSTSSLTSRQPVRAADGGSVRREAHNKSIIDQNEDAGLYQGSNGLRRHQTLDNADSAKHGKKKKKNYYHSKHKNMNNGHIDSNTYSNSNYSRQYSSPAVASILVHSRHGNEQPMERRVHTTSGGNANRNDPTSRAQGANKDRKMRVGPIDERIGGLWSSDDEDSLFSLRSAVEGTGEESSTSLPTTSKAKANKKGTTADRNEKEDNEEDEEGAVDGSLSRIPLKAATTSKSSRRGKDQQKKQSHGGPSVDSSAPSKGIGIFQRLLGLRRSGKEVEKERAERASTKDVNAATTTRPSAASAAGTFGDKRAGGSHHHPTQKVVICDKSLLKEFSGNAATTSSSGGGKRNKGISNTDDVNHQQQQQLPRRSQRTLDDGHRQGDGIHHIQQHEHPLLFGGVGRDGSTLASPEQHQQQQQYYNHQYPHRHHHNQYHGSNNYNVHRINNNERTTSTIHDHEIPTITITRHNDDKERARSLHLQSGSGGHHRRRRHIIGVMSGVETQNRKDEQRSDSYLASSSSSSPSRRSSSSTSSTAKGNAGKEKKRGGEEERLNESSYIGPLERQRKERLRRHLLLRRLREAEGEQGVVGGAAGDRLRNKMGRSSDDNNNDRAIIGGGTTMKGTRRSASSPSALLSVPSGATTATPSGGGATMSREGWSLTAGGLLGTASAPTLSSLMLENSENLGSRGLLSFPASSVSSSVSSPASGSSASGDERSEKGKRGSGRKSAFFTTRTATHLGPASTRPIPTTGEGTNKRNNTTTNIIDNANNSHADKNKSLGANFVGTSADRARFGGTTTSHQEEPPSGQDWGYEEEGTSASDRMMSAIAVGFGRNALRNLAFASPKTNNSKTLLGFSPTKLNELSGGKSVAGNNIPLSIKGTNSTPLRGMNHHSNRLFGSSTTPYSSTAASAAAAHHEHTHQQQIGGGGGGVSAARHLSAKSSAVSTPMAPTAAGAAAHSLFSASGSRKRLQALEAEEGQEEASSVVAGLIRELSMGAGGFVREGDSQSQAGTSDAW